MATSLTFSMTTDREDSPTFNFPTNKSLSIQEPILSETILAPAGAAFLPLGGITTVRIAIITVDEPTTLLINGGSSIDIEDFFIIGGTVTSILATNNGTGNCKVTAFLAQAA